MKSFILAVIGFIVLGDQILGYFYGQPGGSLGTVDVIPMIASLVLIYLGLSKTKISN